MPRTTFYSARHLPNPINEYWPKDVDALRTLLLEENASFGRVLFGGGQHLRAQLLGERPFEAVRTDHCRRILELDRHSGLVRVEAGIRWGDLREKLREDGFSLHNYRPYPEASSVGGLLAKRSAGVAHWLSGDIRAGCVAIAAVSPRLGEYRYLEAPRKACGPDLRHLFIGGEGLLGAILDVTLQVQRPFPARLMSWHAASASEAAALMQAMSEIGLHPAWCHWKKSTARFHAIFHAPTRLLDALVERFQSGYIARESRARIALPTIEGDDPVREFRRELEWDMPEQRSREGAERTLAITYSLAKLGLAIDALGDVEDVEILDWSAHSATAFVTFDNLAALTRAMALVATPGDGATHHALAIQPIIDTTDTPTQWPSWTNVLKQQFDPDQRLAVTP